MNREPRLIKREYSFVDFEHSARFAGVPLTMPERFAIPTQNAARVLWWLHDHPGARSNAGAPNDAAIAAEVFGAPFSVFGGEPF